MEKAPVTAVNFLHRALTATAWVIYYLRCRFFVVIKWRGGGGGGKILGYVKLKPQKMVKLGEERIKTKCFWPIN